jgi:hypothetical protein
MKKSVVLSFFASILILVSCSTTQHQTSAKETKVVILDPDQANAELKRYADDGWACVGVMTGTPVSATDKLRGYMLERSKK